MTVRTLQRPWGRLRLWEAGSGAPLIALHGLGGSGRYWAGLAPHVGNRFRVVAMDLGGFGHSDKPVLAYDREFHLANVDAVVDDVAPGAGVVLVGHSLGGILAALWAAHHSDRVAALALAATPFPAREARMPSHDELVYQRDQRRSRHRLYRTLQLMWPVMTLPVRSRRFPRAVISDYLRHSLPSYWGTARSLLWDPGTEAELDGLRGLAAPSLILNGREDRRVSADCAQGWDDLLPHAQRRVVPGGHQLLLSNHFGPLAEWLERLPAPDTARS